MPTDRERRRQLNDATQRIQAQRNSQQGSQGAGAPSDPDATRNFGFMPPGAPAPGVRRPGGGGRPVDVNVVGNGTVMAGMAAMAGGRGHNGAQAAHQMNAGNINSLQGMSVAAQQITKEMKLSVDAVQQLTRGQATFAQQMAQANTAQLDAVLRLTQVVSATAQAVHQQNQQTTGAGVGPAAPPPQAPAGPSTPSTPTPPNGPPGGPAAWPGGFQGYRGSSYDPGGLLQSGPIHGGARNSYMDMMAHIAAGNDPSTYDPRQFAQAGRNHPTSYGELKHNLRVRAAKFANNSFGEPSIPSLEAQHDDDGNLSHYLYDPKDGSPVETIQPGARANSIASSIAHGYTGAKMVSRMAGGFARAGMGGAIKAIPGLGWAVAGGEAINEGAEWITEQRAANARYQAIEGGTNLSTGVSERFKRFTTRLGERFTGGMTGEQSDQLFDTLTAQGFRGNRRDAYTKVASDNYKQYGMDPMQSAQLITEAANHANTGLLNMATSIKNVTETAVQYGVSAETARGKLVQSLQGVEANGLYGASAMATAGGNTAAVMQLGRSGQNVSFDNMNNEKNTRMQAANLGMGYGQFVARRNKDPMFGAKARDQQIQRFSAQYFTGANGQVAERLIAEAGGRQKVANDPALLDQVLNGMMEQGIDLSNATRMMAAAGVEGIDPNDPMSGGRVGLQEMLQGGKYQQNSTQKSMDERRQRNITPEDRARMLDKDGSGRVANPSRKEGWAAIGDAFGRAFSTEAGSNDYNPLNPFGKQIGMSGASDDPIAVNNQKQLETGKTDPYIESLLDPGVGLSTDKSTGVKVKTKEGDKVVPLATALKDYRDQIADGSATIVGGGKDRDNKTVKEIMGGTTEEGYTQAGPASSTLDPSADAQDEKDYREDHPADDSSGGSGTGDVKVTVEPGPALQNWFKFNTGSGGSTQAGAAAGAPTTPQGLPTVQDGTPGN